MSQEMLGQGGKNQTLEVVGSMALAVVIIWRERFDRWDVACRSQPSRPRIWPPGPYSGAAGEDKYQVDKHEPMTQPSSMSLSAPSPA